MPSHFTKNYQLNQWEAGDRVLRTDFNADNAKVDAAIAAVAAKADTKAENAALDALSGRVETVAENGLRLAVGHYTGDGNTRKSISFAGSLGRGPLVFVVTDGTRLVLWVKGGDTGTVTVTWSGSTLSWSADIAYDAFNDSGRKYRYFALS